MSEPALLSPPTPSALCFGVGRGGAPLWFDATTNVLFGGRGGNGHSRGMCALGMCALGLDWDVAVWCDHPAQYVDLDGARVTDAPLDDPNEGLWSMGLHLAGARRRLVIIDTRTWDARLRETSALTINLRGLLDDPMCAVAHRDPRPAKMQNWMARGFGSRVSLGPLGRARFVDLHQVDEPPLLDDLAPSRGYLSTPGDPRPVARVTGP